MAFVKRCTSVRGSMRAWVSSARATLPASVKPNTPQNIILVFISLPLVLPCLNALTIFLDSPVWCHFEWQNISRVDQNFHFLRGVRLFLLHVWHPLHVCIIHDFDHTVS